eukprot:m.156921 g.156921  ORF g.156921 m.156921 type:complete len:67 (+) comp23642_c1_seq2:3176-3376(+)
MRRRKQCPFVPLATSGSEGSVQKNGGWMYTAKTIAQHHIVTSCSTVRPGAREGAVGSRERLVKSKS